MLRLRSPKSSIALFLLRRQSARVREVSFCKRCVVAYELRGVAFVCGQSPKRVLIEAIQNCRRAARTEKSMRRSRRLALQQFRVQERDRFGSVSEVRMASVKSSSWRPLSVCVQSILRDVRVAKPSPDQGPVAAKLN